jgi:hypothetical protein
MIDTLVHTRIFHLYFLKQVTSQALIDSNGDCSLQHSRHCPIRQSVERRGHLARD